MRRLRDKGVTEGVTEQGVTGEGVTEKGLTSEGVTPAIVQALLDPGKRVKLERISYELNRRSLGGEVRYGIGGPTFEVVEKILEIT